MTEQSQVPENPNAAIEEAALDAADLARSQQQVALQFPSIGFIDPEKELQALQIAYNNMPPDLRTTYPEMIRAKVIAYEAAKGTPKEADNPNPTDEEFALALYCKRSMDSPLTQEDVTAKVTGKSARVPKPAKETKQSKEAAGAAALSAMFGKK